MKSIGVKSLKDRTNNVTVKGHEPLKLVQRRILEQALDVSLCFF